MSVIAGSLEIQLLANIARLQSDMRQAQGIVEKSVGAIEARVSKLQNIFATGFVASGFLMVARQAMEAEQAINRLDAVVRATGNASGYTADQLHSLADAMAAATQFDDEDIRGATASILKFGNVHGETLKRALQLSADYAAFTGTNVTSAAEALGKALSSPAQGIERLQRQIGYLNPAQVEAIKNMQEMGDIAGAQSAVMEILTQKIGGVAEAMNTGYTKAFGDAKKASGEFFETLGATALVAGTVQSFLGFVASSMRDMKAIIEDGDWVQALKFVLGFRQTADQAAARNPAKEAKANTEAASAAALEAEKKFRQALTDQDEKFIAGALKRQKEAAEAAQKLRVAGAEAELKAEEMFAEDYAAAWRWADHYRTEESKAEAKDRLTQAEAEAKANEMFADDYAEAWKFANEYVRKEDARHLQAAKDQYGGFIDGIEGAFRAGFDRIGGGWGSMVSAMRDAFKRTLMDFIYQSLARPFILNVVAMLSSSMGMTGLASLASTATGASGMSAGLSGINLLGRAGSFLSGLGGSVGSLGSGLTFANSAGMLAGLGEIGGAGTMAFQLGAALPGIGTAIAVAALLYSIFKDKGENPNFRFTQGSGGEGAFGGIATQGNYSFSQMGDLQRYVGGLDSRFSSILGAEGSASAAARLAAYSARGLRMDGQPAQFAFPEGDSTAGEQLAMELLQSRYSILFEGIDEGIAQQIREWSGTSSELQTFIETMVGVVEGLAQLNIRGLDTEALRALGLAGETLDQTFQRVSGTWSWFQQNFTTDAERLETAQKQVVDAFASLGIAVPASITDFRLLVESLDLSTESGRAMFTALMTVAPAFLAVEDAAGNATSAIEDTNAALEAQADLQRRIADDVRASRQQQLDRVIGARSGLQGFLRSTLLDTGMTVLDPMERLGIAQEEFETLLLAAQGGDLSAADRLGGSADTYLRIAREIFASGSGFVDIFNRVTAGVSAVDDRLAIDQRQLEATLGIAQSSAEMVEGLRNVYHVLIDIRDRPAAVTAPQAAYATR